MLLQDFINAFLAKGLLKEEKKFVDPHLQMAEYVDRMSKKKHGGQAVFFRNTGTDFPVVMNLMGSDERLANILRCGSIQEVGEKVQSLANLFMNPAKSGKFKLIKTLFKLTRIRPRHVRKGICQQNRMPVPDLTKLPIIQCWPHDGGRFITLPVVHTIDPETGKRNVGMYRMQVFDSKTTGMHWHMHKDGASHFQKYKNRGEKMPVAVTLGGDPVYTYAATAPLPKDVDEYLLAGFLREEAVKLVSCVSQPLRVPADADIVLEGYVDPQEDLAWEGPFGDHTGFYSHADWYPKFHLTAITYKNNAVYPATLVGIPPQEDFYIARATEILFLPVLQNTILPELHDMHIPGPGVGHNLTLFSFRKAYPGHALKMMHALWGAGQMMFNKVLIAFDVDMALTDYHELIKIIVQEVDIESDIFLNQGPLDVLDHATSLQAFGGKLFIDATHKPINKEDKKRDSVVDNDVPYDLLTLKQTSRAILQAKQFLLDEEKYLPFLAVSVDMEQDPAWETKLLNALKEKAYYPMLLVVLDDVELEVDLYTLLWFILSHIDPNLDLRKKSINAAHKCLWLDATKKEKRSVKGEKWPAVVLSDSNTINQVDKILGTEKASSPSEKMKHFLHFS